MAAPVTTTEKRSLIASLLKYETAKLNSLHGLDHDVARRRCEVIEGILTDYQEERRELGRGND